MLSYLTVLGVYYAVCNGVMKTLSICKVLESGEKKKYGLLLLLFDCTSFFFPCPPLLFLNNNEQSHVGEMNYAAFFFRFSSPSTTCQADT